MMLLLPHRHPIPMLLIQDIPHQTNLLPHMELDKYILLGKGIHLLKDNQFLGKNTHLLMGNLFLDKDTHLRTGNLFLDKDTHLLKDNLFLDKDTHLLKDNLFLDKLQQMEVCEAFCFNKVLYLSI